MSGFRWVGVPSIGSLLDHGPFFEGDWMRQRNQAWLSGLLLVVTIWARGETCVAQDTEPHSAAQLPTAVELPAKTVWKFGVRITGTGNTRNVQVTFPLPVDWKDQKIKVLSIDGTQNTKGGRIKKLGQDASQFFFKVPELNVGDVAEATVTVEIEKLESQPPIDPDQFVFSKKNSRKLRNYLTPSPFIESNDDRIKEIAERLEIDDSLSAWQQVEAIYRWVRENIQYEFDTEIRSCLQALDAGHGDCEELSSLFIALCRARGIPARAVWIPEHTYPEFYLEDAEGNGRWFPCQAAGTYAFGHMPEARPILQKGDKFKVKGHPRPLRYIQPTMQAYGDSPTWEWLMTQLEEPVP